MEYLKNDGRWKGSYIAIGLEVGEWDNATGFHLVFISTRAVTDGKMQCLLWTEMDESESEVRTERGGVMKGGVVGIIATSLCTPI